MKLTLPYPPSCNHYWRHVGVRVLISKKGRDYRTAVNAAVRLQCGWKSDPLAGRLTLSMLAWMPDRRRRDLDNLTKSALDAMQDAGVYADDSQIDRLVVERAGVDTARPRIEGRGRGVMTQIYVRFSSVGQVHRYDSPAGTMCGIPLGDAKPVKTPRRVGRCKSCERVAELRTALTDAWVGNKPINRMAMLRELVGLRNQRRR